MSKAFTREEPSAEAEDMDSLDASRTSEAVLGLPPGTKNYITPRGAQRLKDELHDLLTVVRPELVRTVSWAASNGDRSENGDYIYGKRRLREIDRRIRFLTRRLEIAEIIDPKKRGVELGQGKDLRVLFGAQVQVEHESGQIRDYQIVGIDEAEVSSGRISWISPLAKVLLNSKVGESVHFHSPKGDEELVVLRIDYS